MFGFDQRAIVSKYMHAHCSSHHIDVVEQHAAQGGYAGMALQCWKRNTLKSQNLPVQARRSRGLRSGYMRAATG